MLGAGKTSMPAVAQFFSFLPAGSAISDAEVDSMALNGGVFLGDCMTSEPAPTDAQSSDASPDVLRLIDDALKAEDGKRSGYDLGAAVFPGFGGLGHRGGRSRAVQKLFASPDGDANASEGRTFRVHHMKDVRIGREGEEEEGIELGFIIASIPADVAVLDAFVGAILETAAPMIEWYSSARIVIKIDEIAGSIKEVSQRIQQVLVKRFKDLPASINVFEVRLAAGKTSYMFRMKRRQKGPQKEPPAPEVPVPIVQYNLVKLSKPGDPTVLRCDLAAADLPAALSMFAVVKIIGEALQKEALLDHLIIDLSLEDATMPYPLAQTWAFVEQIPVDIFPEQREIKVTFKFGEVLKVNYALFRGRSGLRRIYIDRHGARFEIMEINRDETHRYYLLVQNEERVPTPEDPAKEDPTRVKIFIDQAVEALAGETMKDVMRDAADIVRQRKGFRELIFIIPNAKMFAREGGKILNEWARYISRVDEAEARARVAGTSDSESTMVIDFRLIGVASASRVKFKVIRKLVKGVLLPSVSLLSWGSIAMNDSPPLLHQPAQRRTLAELTRTEEPRPQASAADAAALPAAAEPAAAVPAENAPKDPPRVVVKPALRSGVVDARKPEARGLSFADILGMPIGRLLRKK